MVETHTGSLTIRIPFVLCDTQSLLILLLNGLQLDGWISLSAFGSLVVCILGDHETKKQGFEVYHLRFEMLL